MSQRLPGECEKSTQIHQGLQKTQLANVLFVCQSCFIYLFFLHLDELMCICESCAHLCVLGLSLTDEFL